MIGMGEAESSVFPREAMKNGRGRIGKFKKEKMGTANTKGKLRTRTTKGKKRLEAACEVRPEIAMRGEEPTGCAKMSDTR